MKDLETIKLCLGLELKHKTNGILVHQSAYTKQILERFNMVVRSLEPHKDPFRPKEPDEEILDPEVPYLNAIGALMYLA